MQPPPRLIRDSIQMIYISEEDRKRAALTKEAARAFMVDRSGIRPLPTLPWSTAEAERLGFWIARRHRVLTSGGYYA